MKLKGAVPYCRLLGRGTEAVIQKLFIYATGVEHRDAVARMEGVPSGGVHDLEGIMVGHTVWSPLLPRQVSLTEGPFVRTIKSTPTCV